jgi:TPR repeat protein
MNGSGIPKDEEAARQYFSRLESNTDARGLFQLALMLRSGKGVPLNTVEALRWYRRSAELGHVDSLEHLGLCYEKGVGVDADLAEAARLYQQAAELGSVTGRLSLGLFRWRGLAGFPVDRREAVRLWRLGGLDVPDSAATGGQAGSIALSDSAPRSSRFASSGRETEATESEHRINKSLALLAEADMTLPDDSNSLITSSFRSDMGESPPLARAEERRDSGAMNARVPESATPVVCGDCRS